jgi:hypothetical protein
MRATDDGFARARRALRQVDTEVERGRSGTDPLPPDEGTVFEVEILPAGQRPARPRRRATVWALAASVALLCGAGVGVAALWPEPGGTAPGSQLPASPSPGTAREPAPGSSPSTLPRECVPTPIPSAAPGRTADAPPSDACETVPAPSTSTDQAEP